jgi:hypothetical protein
LCDSAQADDGESDTDQSLHREETPKYFFSHETLLFYRLTLCDLICLPVQVAAQWPRSHAR